MSGPARISGSMIVYRNELSRKFSIERIVNLHENLQSGPPIIWRD
jgi:hypothetical protein